jgi:acid phosphatase family membrane protein YuiD
MLGEGTGMSVPTSTTPYFTMAADFDYFVLNEAARLEDFFNDVAEHLAQLGAEDISIMLDENKQSFSVSLLVASQEYESIETVVGKGMGMIRTALHFCNARTPQWPTAQDALFRGVEVRPATLKGQESANSPMLASA